MRCPGRSKTPALEQEPQKAGVPVTRERRRSGERKVIRQAYRQPTRNSAKLRSLRSTFKGIMPRATAAKLAQGAEREQRRAAAAVGRTDA